MRRQWAGLLRGYYLPRWEKFFAFVAAQPPGYRDDQLPRVGVRPRNDANAFYEELTRWEYAWRDGHEKFPDQPSGDPVLTAKSTVAKWEPVMREAYPRFDWVPYGLPKAYLTSKPIR